MKRYWLKSCDNGDEGWWCVDFKIAEYVNVCITSGKKTRRKWDLHPVPEDYSGNWTSYVSIGDGYLYGATRTTLKSAESACLRFLSKFFLDLKKQFDNYKKELKVKERKSKWTLLKQV